ncbi:MAG: hypothetical protein R2860_17390 [Desulfobacterales bacterium]
MKKTKIIATISNHLCDVPFLEQMFAAGMNVVRTETPPTRRPRKH